MYKAKETFQYLLTLNLQAFEAGEYDAAFHALASALHLAQAMQDAPLLDLISNQATAQKKQINLIAPDYKHSSKKAEKRGNRCIFATLSGQAHAAANIARAQVARNEKNTLFTLE